jgi:radical SAM/Cys-rich protein
MLETLPLLNKIIFPAINRKNIDIVQINLGYRCNQQCLHCHVNAGPKRSEEMSLEVLDQTFDFIKKYQIKTVDLTGGAPEMHPKFIEIIETLHEMGVKVIDRCNLTIINEPGYENLANKMAENEVKIVASMPCYMEENVNKQRGNGVFDSSIKALKILNQLGYGKNIQKDSDKQSNPLVLNLVFNPQDASLAPKQSILEKDYKHFLFNEFGIVFDQLFTITNVPVKRFGSLLISKNEFHPYMDLLQQAYQPENLEGVMCRHQLSIDWQGYLYDCDFNQMLNLPLTRVNNSTGHCIDKKNSDHKKTPKDEKFHISNVSLEDLNNKKIIVSGHCFACTAGQGSSCGGSLS